MIDHVKAVLLTLAILVAGVLAFAALLWALVALGPISLVALVVVGVGIMIYPLVLMSVRGD